MERSPFGTFEPFETKRLQTVHREPGIRSTTVEPRGAARVLSALNPEVAGSFAWLTTPAR
jgi:hypothetical protein